MNFNTSTKTRNILKAALPFIPVSAQRSLSAFLKVEEFRQLFDEFNDSIDKTLSACQSPQGNSVKFNSSELLGAIRPYLTPKEYDMIQTMINVFQFYQIYNSVSAINQSAAPQNTNFNNSTVPQTANYNNSTAPQNTNFNNSTVPQTANYNNMSASPVATDSNYGHPPVNDNIALLNSLLDPNRSTSHY